MVDMTIDLTDMNTIMVVVMGMEEDTLSSQRNSSPRALGRS